MRRLSPILGLLLAASAVAKPLDVEPGSQGVTLPTEQGFHSETVESTLEAAGTVAARVLIETSWPGLPTGPRPEAQMGSIRLSVTDATSGEPLSGASYVLRDKKGEVATGVVSSSSVLTVGDLAPGMYKLTIDKEGWRSETVKAIKVGVGKRATVPVSLTAKSTG